jgi:hypothetical protein
MVIDSSTIIGAIILFITTTIFISFVITKTNPSYIQKDDNKPNILKSVGLSVVLSLLFTCIITYISLKVDKHNFVK